MRSCERDDTDGRCTLKGSEENVGIEIVIPDAQLERYEDGFNNENTIQRDGIKAQRTRPDDDPHVILAALRDSSCQCWYSWPVSALELISVSIPEVLEILGTSCLIRIEPVPSSIRKGVPDLPPASKVLSCVLHLARRATVVASSNSRLRVNE